MTLAQLDNLVKTGKIKTEPADQKEFEVWSVLQGGV